MKKANIVNLPPSSFATDFNKMLNAKYTVQAAPPQRVGALLSDLHDPRRNRVAAAHLEKQPHEVILSVDQGKLKLFDSAIVFLTEDSDFPVSFLYTFKSIMFSGKPAVWEDKIECFDPAKDVRIDGLPLSAYSLFRVLLPRFKIIVGGDQHTPQGERWSKRQIKEAIAQGLHVYLRNDAGELYNADTYDVVKMNEDYLWGVDEEHRKRLTVILRAVRLRHSCQRYKAPIK